jgi:hypothetical protein
MPTGDLQADRDHLYALLQQAQGINGGVLRLSDCHGRMDWPDRGVYFFYEPEEERGDHSRPPRIVRVGTHALKVGSKSTLWGRLSQHKGNSKGTGGNHRGSIFRLLVGDALMRRGDHPPIPSWGFKADMGQAAAQLGVDRAELKQAEASLEEAVSRYIGTLPFTWIAVADEPGPESDRGYMERNAIALLSNFNDSVGEDSSNWLGRYCSRNRVNRSRLWNNNHVDESYSPDYLHWLSDLIEGMRAGEV